MVVVQLRVKVGVNNSSYIINKGGWTDFCASTVCETGSRRADKMTRMCGLMK